MFVAFTGLDVEGLADVVPFVRLSGTHVTTVEGLSGEGGIQRVDVSVYDIRHAHRIARTSRGVERGFRLQPALVAKAPATRGAQRDTVSALVVSRAGLAAWIGENLDSRAFEVHSLDTHGDRLLDAGTDIDPRSLQLTGRTLAWRHAGATKSSPL